MKNIFGIIVVFAIVAIVTSKDFQKSFEPSEFEIMENEYLEAKKLEKQAFLPLLYRIRRSPQIPQVPDGVPTPPVTPF